MSDVFEGPGWWLASNGKWYPPHLHHDPEYRRAHGTDAAPDKTTTDNDLIADEPVSNVLESELDGDAGADVQPRMPQPSVVPVPGSVGEMLAGVDEVPEDDEADHGETGESHELSAAEPEHDRGQERRGIDEEPRRLGVDEEPVPGDRHPGQPGATRRVETSHPLGEEPIRESTPVSEILGQTERERRRTDGSSETPDETPVGGRAQSEKAPLEEPSPDSGDSGERVSTSRARLEVGNTQSTSRPRRPPNVVGDQPHQPKIGLQDDQPVSTSTDLVPVTTQHHGPTPVDLYDRVVAGILFLAGVAMIVGTFMAWDVGPGSSTTGWELGDGLATVIAGVLGSAAAGPIFVGFRHILPKTIAIVAGLVGVVVVGLSGLQVVTDSDTAGTSVGTGFWIVVIGSIAMLAAGLADRSALD